MFTRTMGLSEPGESRGGDQTDRSTDGASGDGGSRKLETFEHRGLAIRYARSGAGSPVVLLHNGGTSHAIWDEITPLLEGHETFALDLLGFGASDKPGRGYELEAHVAILEAFVDALGLSPTSLVGNCMGSATALAFAMRRPRDVRALVLMNTLTPSTFETGRYGPMRELPRRAPRLVSALSRVGLGARLGTYGVRSQLGRLGVARHVHERGALCACYAHGDQSRALLEVLADIPRYAALERFTPPPDFPPICTLWGLENRVLPAERGRRLVETLQPARQEWLEGCGHLPMLERPQEVAAIVSDFLRAPGPGDVQTRARREATVVPFAEDVFDLASVAREVARVDPGRIAVVEPDGRGEDGKRRYRRSTYEELSHDAESIAVGLREVGIAERTRTVFMAPPSYEACAVYLALTRVGATVVMIDPSVGYRNVAERLGRLRPEAFVGIPLTHAARVTFGWGPRVTRKAIVVDGHFPGAHTLASLRRSAPAEPVRADVTPEDPMCVLYTTGSTGPAKPALYSHRAFCGMFRTVRESWALDPSRGLAVDMAAFPAFFIVGLSLGGTVVVPPIDFTRQTPATADPAALLEVIDDCGVRSLFGSPVLLENLARHADAHGRTAPSLERVIGGGAPITGPTMARLSRMMPNGEAFANYGATEAMPSTRLGARETLADTWAKTKAGRGICVGRPFSTVELRIARIQDRAAVDFETLPTGEIGEILVRSPHVSGEYLDDTESTRKNKIGTWHRLGDAGYLDEQGRLWICGRVSQRVRGPNGPLFSLLAEPIFDAHPSVRRSGLVGVADGASERPVICIELEAESDVDRDALREELLALAARHRTTQDVRDVLFLDRLPVDPRHQSKIERPKLARWAAEELERSPSLGSDRASTPLAEPREVRWSASSP